MLSHSLSTDFLHREAPPRHPRYQSAKDLHEPFDKRALGRIALRVEGEGASFSGQRPQ